MTPSGNSMNVLGDLDTAALAPLPTERTHDVSAASTCGYTLSKHITGLARYPDPDPDPDPDILLSM